MTQRRLIFGLARAAQQLGHRVGLGMLLAAAVLLLILSKTHENGIAQMRAVVLDGLAPTLAALSRPIATVRTLTANVQALFAAHEENYRLRADIARLQQWKQVALNLEDLNLTLRQQLNLQVPGRPQFVTARVITDSGSPFVKTVMIHAGRAAGVRKGAAAATGAGLVGRITDVGNNAARVLLLTDLNMRVPVLIKGRGRYRAIMAGDNTERPTILHLPGQAQIAPGDRVVTSGHAGIFPPGLAIGVVASMGDAGIRVRPYADLRHMDFVTVIQFEKASLADHAGITPAPLLDRPQNRPSGRPQ